MYPRAPCVLVCVRAFVCTGVGLCVYVVLQAGAFVHKYMWTTVCLPQRYRQPDLYNEYGKEVRSTIDKDSTDTRSYAIPSAFHFIAPHLIKGQ